jgi:hypothetical protein
MKRLIWLLSLVVVAQCAGFAQSPNAAGAQAETVLNLKWRDLIPKLPPFEDPFRRLTQEQLGDLSEVARVRARVERDQAPSSAKQDRLAKLERKLADQGIDIGDLLARRAEITEKRRQAAEAINNDLSSKRVRLAGYLLPIELDGALIKEFLLVPYVGACIHVPPPPANQVVHVSYDPGFKANSLFAPVWVEGVLETGLSHKKLHLVDGSADVGVGYSMVAKSVVDYDQ